MDQTLEPEQATFGDRESENVYLGQLTSRRTPHRAPHRPGRSRQIPHPSAWGPSAIAKGPLLTVEHHCVGYLP
jgi:hypothetical protein